MRFLSKLFITLILYGFLNACSITLENGNSSQRNGKIKNQLRLESDERESSYDCARLEEIIKPDMPSTPVTKFSKIDPSNTQAKMLVLTEHIRDLNKYIIEYEKRVRSRDAIYEFRCLGQ